ncbi:MAG: metallophosphoesterase [Clostridia bacterium]
MKIFAISDLHLSTTTNKPMNIFGGNWENYWQKIKTDWAEKVSEDDLVLVCGDLSWAMTLQDAQADIEQVGQLKGKKIIIKGNHDYWWQSYSKVVSTLPKNFFAIQNNCLRFENVLISGTRLWTMTNQTADDKKIVEREYLRLKLCLNELEKQRRDGDKTIFLCHFPPFDVTLSDNKFTQLFDEHAIDYVVYGHLHGKDSRSVLQLQKNNTQYLLTSCDLVDNKLIEIVF